MSPHENSASIGGVRNLRAIFENNQSEDRSASPPSRGRSPALSEASIHSRPVSKVRAGFVVVERPGDTEEGQHWGLRKASDVANMADIQQELDNCSLVNGVSSTSNAHSQMNGVHGDSQPQSQQHVAEETTQGGLGSILKGSSFETSPPATKSKPPGLGSRESPTSPSSPKKSPGATRMNGKPTPGVPPKSVGSRIKDAVSSKHNQPPPPTKLNTTKSAQPIKPPPTRQAPFSKSSTKSPTSPRTPRASLSPKTERPTTKGSAPKPLAVAESARNGVSPEQEKRSPTLPREPRRSSLKTPSPTTARHGPSSPRTNRVKKDPKPTSPEIKPRPSRVSASAAAPTAASAARNTNPTSLTRKPTTTRRDRPSAKTTVSTAPVVKKPPRTSLHAPADAADRTKPRTSGAKSTPNDGFLARMMRPTASSAQKAHEKAAPSSPPQSKRAAPLQAAKGRARRSITTSTEDKENSHRGGPEIHNSPLTVEARQADMNGDGKVESHPLNDITPVVEPDEATAPLATEGGETSST